MFHEALTLTHTETSVEVSTNQLETERLLIRRFALSDSPFIIKLLNQKSFIDNIRDSNVRSLSDAENYIQKLSLSCVTLKDGTPIGMNGLIKRETLPYTDIGFAFLDQYMGKGYAFESSVAVLNDGFKRLDTIAAITSPGNNASISLLMKLGFSYKEMVEVKPGDPVKLFLKTAETFGHRA